MNIDILLLNAIVYVLTLTFAWMKLRRFNLFVLLWIAYSIVAVSGYYCVVNDLHYSHDANLGYKVAPEPYLFAYLTNLLITSPFYRMDVGRLELSHIVEIKLYKQIAGLIAVFFTLQLVTSIIILVFVQATIGMGNAYYMIHEGVSVLSSSPLLAKMSWISGLLTPIVKPVYAVYTIQKLIQNKGSKYKNIYLFLIAFLPGFITDIAMGSKGGLFFSVFEMLFYYVLFWKAIPQKINKTIMKFGTILGVAILAN